MHRLTLTILLCLLCLPSAEAAKKYRGRATYSGGSNQNWSHASQPAIRHALSGNCKLWRQGRCSMCSGIRALPWKNIGTAFNPHYILSPNRATQRMNAKPPAFVSQSVVSGPVVSSRIVSSPAESTGTDTGPAADVFAEPIESLKSAVQGLSAIATIDAVGEKWQLTSKDCPVSTGCGPATELLRWCQHYGCDAIGIEIDPEVAAEARQAVIAAEGKSIREGQIQIITGDVLDPETWAQCERTPTHTYAYLLPDLVADMWNRGLVKTRFAAIPGHAIEGVRFVEEAGVYYYDSEATGVPIYRLPPIDASNSIPDESASAGASEPERGRFPDAGKTVARAETGNAYAAATETNVVRLYFTAPGCAPCAVMWPKAAKFKPKKINGWSGTWQTAYGVTQWPTMLRIWTDSKGQRKMRRLVGIVSEAKLRELYR